MVRDKNECRWAAPTLTESHSSSHYLLSYRVSIYSVSEADTLSSCVSLCCFLPTLTHFHSTLFRDFSMSFTQMHFVFPPRFFHWFLLSFGVSCFSRFSRCDVHKIQFLLRNKISPFLRSLFPSSHQPNTRTLHCDSLWVLLVVLSSVCVSVCVMSHLFYDSVPDFELIPCCLVLATFLACPANDKVGFAYAVIKVALIPKQSWLKNY